MQVSDWIKKSKMMEFSGHYSRNYWKFIILFLTLCGMWASPGGVMALIFTVPFLSLVTGLTPLASAQSIVILAGGLEVAAISLLIVYLHYRIGWTTSRVKFCIYGSLLGCLGGAAHSLIPFVADLGIGMWFLIVNGACSGLFVSFITTKLLPAPEQLGENIIEFERRMIGRLTIPLGLAVLVLIWWLSASVGFVEL